MNKKKKSIINSTLIRPPSINPSITSDNNFISGTIGNIIQGMAIGTGSQLASRTIDNIMGPREIQIKNIENNNCNYEIKLYNECIENSKGDETQCKKYLEMIKEYKNLNLKI